MINVVIRVERPYHTRPPLAAGLFVNVEITGRSLPDAARISRAALRQGGIAWVVKDGRLHFRRLDVALIQDDTALIRSGLGDGDLVVISTLKSVSDGMRVRVAEPEKEG